MISRTFVRVTAAFLALALPASQLAGGSAGLRELANRSYLEITEGTPAVFDRAQFEALRKELDTERKAEETRLKSEEKRLDQRLGELRDQLKSLNKEASSDTPAAAKARNDVHCEILRLEAELRNKRVEREHGMPVAFDNRQAKLDLIEIWPARKREIDREIKEGRARQRPYGDVDDIGVRKISDGQEKDIKLGEDAVREMKTLSLMPKELDDKATSDYIQAMADRIAANSDVKVPVKLSVLYSKEINAFALPGGFLFVNTGLVERTETETELAGVIAHELAHVAGRHGAKLMRRATIAGLMYQMAQVAVMIGTGGIASIGAYYVFQAGFLGLGLVLDLSLLGVNRKFEADADQLGAQYAWKAGYDPRGFITFFDKMAREQGYIRSASFFRTHPPFFERILSTVTEIHYLPKEPDLVTDSSRFREFKAQLSEVLKKASEKKLDAPTLRREPKCEDPGQKPGDSAAIPACAICGDVE